MSLVPKPLSSQRTKKCLFMFKMKILLLPSIATKNDLHSVTKDVSINFGMNLCWLRKKRNKHPFWTPLRKKSSKRSKTKLEAQMPSSDSIMLLLRPMIHRFLLMFSGISCFQPEKKKNVYRPSKLINMIHLKMGRCLEF